MLAEALALDVEARTPTVAALLAGLRRIQSGRERLLDGRYELLRPLGVGGRAEVMLAHHRLAGRDVALKRLHAGRQTEEERARLRREARVLAELRHPAFPSLYDVHEHDGQLYLAMEFMQGERAGNLVQQPLCPAHVLAVGIQLADALVALHSLGVNELAHALLAALHPDPLHRFDAPGLLARLTEAAELQAAEDRGPEPS